jgi:oligopeptide transport system ATP-binding protein
MTAARGSPVPLLQVSGLTTTFDTPHGVVTAVDDVTFSLSTAEVLGLVGESGSGKSVTGLSIMRLVAPPGKVVAGEVVFDGTDLTKVSDAQMRRLRGREIAMIFQDPMTSLNPLMKVGTQIAETVRIHKQLGRRDARARTIELLTLVGIPAAAARYDDFPYQFSGGMRQRVMIAMALACDPKLLIADEPTTALDVTIQAQILDLLRRVREELGTAIIMITHDLGVIAGMADRVHVMYAGRIVESGTAERLFASPEHPYTEGLLRSVPRIDQSLEGEMPQIKGTPPDPTSRIPGCAFNPRCAYAIDRCRSERPPLEDLSSEHAKACWVDLHAAKRAAS